MSTEDDRRAIERFVAGAPVDAATLATAITARAVDREIVVEALLKGLASPEAVVRRRAAERAARLPDLAPRVAARLEVLAVHDEDGRTREASAIALRTHAGDDPAAREPEPQRPRFVLGLKVATLRSTGLQGIVPSPLTSAPDLRVTIREEDGDIWLDLTGLPAAFAGTRPILRVARDPGSGPREVAQAEAPVSPDGTGRIRIPRETASLDELLAWMSNRAQLVVPDE